MVTIDEQSRAWYVNSVINPDPFNVLINILGMWKSMEQKDPKFMSTIDSDARDCMSLFSKFFFIPNPISKAKVVHIDKELLPSIINTDNELFFRNTGLPVMFINQEFQYNDNILIKGMMIANTKELMDKADPLIKMELAFKDKGDMFKPHLLLLVLYIETMTQDMLKDNPGASAGCIENWLGFTLENYREKYRDDEDKRRVKICEYVSTLACNIIDVMNHDVETIEINTIVSTREENDKRIKRGKPPIPTKVYIRPKSEHRNYYVNLNNEVRELGHSSHRYIVRGHWRHLRSDKWKQKKGTSIWIKMQIRGKGIFVEKKYKLEGR